MLRNIFCVKCFTMSVTCIMTKYILSVTFSHLTDVKNCIPIAFREDFYGDVRFTVALQKLTENNEKLKNVLFSQTKTCFSSKNEMTGMF